MLKKWGIMACILLIALPLVQAGFLDDLKVIEPKVTAFIEDNNSIIVRGSYITAAEKTAFAFLKERYPKVAGTPSIADTDLDPDQTTFTTFIIVGGPTQNTHASLLLNDPLLTVEYDNLTFGKVAFITSDADWKAIVLSDHAGFLNLPRSAISKSPLARFIPPEYIPLAATAIGFLLLWFWQFLSQLFLKILRFILSSKVMQFFKKRHPGEKYVGFRIRGVHFKAREWLSIFIAAFVFAASLTYMYLAPNMGVLKLLVIVTVVNLGIYGFRHLVRLILDRHHDIHTEYVVWWWGAIITALTGWLGNTFSLAGYMITHDDKGEKHDGKIAFWVNALTFVLFAVFLIWNMLSPSVIVQMAMLLSLAITYLQMLPLTPFSGKKIYQWKRSVWWISFVPLTIIYIFINIVL
ncbi:MAG: hypothetical protein ABIH34_04215 [Nanoarchaeota archaeon]